MRKSSWMMCFYGIFLSCSEEKLTEVNVFDPLPPRKPAQTAKNMSNSVHMVSYYGANVIMDLESANRVG